MDDLFNYLFIEDGYTQTRTIPAVPGMHPELRIVFRPALAKERIAYSTKTSSRDPAVLEQHEVALIEKYLESLNGARIDKAKIARLKPNIRTYILDLVLGYVPADEGADAKN